MISGASASPKWQALADRRRSAPWGCVLCVHPPERAAARNGDSVGGCGGGSGERASDSEWCPRRRRNLFVGSGGRLRARSYRIFAVIHFDPCGPDPPPTQPRACASPGKEVRPRRRREAARDDTARVTVMGLTVVGARRERDTRAGVVSRGGRPIADARRASGSGGGERAGGGGP